MQPYGFRNVHEMMLAQASREAYAALLPEQQASLHVFLLSLTRTPKVRVPL